MTDTDNTRKTPQWEGWHPCSGQSSEYHSGYNQALRDTAASHMLEALRVADTHLMFNMDEHMHPRDFIRAAIAKATGGAA